jgi:hypothetical protein
VAPPYTRTDGALKIIQAGPFFLDTNIMVALFDSETFFHLISLSSSVSCFLFRSCLDAGFIVIFPFFLSFLFHSLNEIAGVGVRVREKGRGVGANPYDLQKCFG